MPNRTPGEFLSTSFAINLKITLGIILAILTLITIFIYLSVPTSQNNIKFIISVIGGAAAVYTGYYVAASIAVSIKNSKMQHAFEILRDLNQSVVNETRIEIEKRVDINKQGLDALYKEIRGNDTLSIGVTKYLDLLEDLSIMVQKEYADEHTLYLSLARIVPKLQQDLGNYIDKERNRLRYAGLYIEFEQLAKSWKEGKSLVTGKKYPPIV
jgi:hypothetical protein